MRYYYNMNLEHVKWFLLKVAERIDNRCFTDFENASFFFDLLDISRTEMSIVGAKEYVELGTDQIYRGHLNLVSHLQQLLKGKLHVGKGSNVGKEGFGIYFANLDIARKYAADDQNVFVAKLAPDAKIAPRQQVVDCLKDSVDKIVLSRNTSRAEELWAAEDYLRKENLSPFAMIMGYDGVFNNSLTMLNREKIITTPPHNYAELGRKH